MLGGGSVGSQSQKRNHDASEHSRRWTTVFVVDSLHGIQWFTSYMRPRPQLQTELSLIKGDNLEAHLRPRQVWHRSRGIDTTLLLLR